MNSRFTGGVMRIRLTAAPTHGAYRELVQCPPAAVEYSWPERSTGVGNARSHAALALQSLGLPRFIPLPGRSAWTLTHSCQHLLWTTSPWVVDIEHSTPFVGTSFSHARRAVTAAVIARLLASDACRAILPWSETAAQGFRANFRRWPEIVAKVTVVRPAVAVPRTEPRAAADRPTILFVANAPEWNFLLKGGRELIAAFAALRARWRDLRLTVVGPVALSVRSEYANLEGLEFTGRLSRDELRAHYSAAHVFAMPSFSDTFGMVYLEAMSHGLPIVALERVYTRDIVQHGKSGLLVPLGSHSIRFCDEDGRFLLDSADFIRAVVRAPVDRAVVDGVVYAVEELLQSPERHRQLSAGALGEISSGRFSVQQRNAALGLTYSTAIA